MKKAIILARVSTESQDYEAQLSELLQFAGSCGYDESKTTAVAVKESAIRLAEEERLGLNEMKRLVETGEYDAVFVWEVSRLARTKKVLFSVVDFLVTRGVQLYVKNPYIKLIKDDGTVDEGAEMVFTLFAQLAEAEMRNKRDRFKRAKAAKKAKGGFIGGGCPVPYDVVNKKFVLNEERAEMVRLAFHLYADGLSLHKVSFELASRGTAIHPSTLSRIFSDPRMKGEHGCPRVVSDEVFEHCRERAANNNREASKVRYVYLALGLFTCPVCGEKMVASGNRTYACAHMRDLGDPLPETLRRVANREFPKRACTNNRRISADLVDSILWHLAKAAEAGSMFKMDEARIAELEAKEAELDVKIGVCEQRLGKEKARLERASSLYIDGYIDRAAFDSRKDKIAEARKEILGEQSGWEEEKRRTTALLERQRSRVAMSSRFRDFRTYLAELDEIRDRRVMREIVLRNVASLQVSDVMFTEPGTDVAKAARRLSVVLADGSRVEIACLTHRGRENSRAWKIGTAPDGTEYAEPIVFARLGK